MKRINLALLINSFNLGGAEKLIYDLAESYDKNNIICHIISMAPIESKLEKQLSKKMKGKGIKIYSLNKKYKKNRLKSILELYNYIKKNEIDILHTNGQSPDFYGRIAKLFIPKCKLIVTIHNTSGYNKYIELFLQLVTNQYTAVSEQTLEYCKSILIKKEIKVIHNGIDIKKYSRTNYNKNKKKVILTVGRMVEQKGYFEIASRMNSFLKDNANYDWYILGNLDDIEYKKRFINQFDERVLRQIHLVGVVQNAEDYYKKADYFLLNSKYEGFGIAIIEAIAAKLPVYVTNVGVVPDLLNNHCKLNIINQDSTIDFNNSFIDTKELNYNYSYIEKKYSLYSVAKEYEELYKKVLNTHKETYEKE